jgi:hypothetical protein
MYTFRVKPGKGNAPSFTGLAMIWTTAFRLGFSFGHIRTRFRCAVKPAAGTVIDITGGV